MTSDDLKQAATLLRALGLAERARLRHPDEASGDVRRYLDSVDPVEAFALSAILDVEASIHSVGASRRSTRTSDRRATRTPW